MGDAAVGRITPRQERASMLYVVGVGASAGGLEALERVFRAVPADTGMAFVVVQHLAMEHRSMMPELAAKWTEMPVRQAEDRIALRADHIYLLPPGKEMILSENRLLLTDRDPDQTLSLPIDRFFASLARDRGRHAIAVVLSGTGSDGSRGLVRVRDAGGLVIAQTAETAEFDGMPRSAFDTGAVHVALPPEKIGPTLAAFGCCPDLDAVIEAARPVRSGGEGLTRVFELLREAYGIDFADYKISTVSRRTERRILLGRAVDLEDYVDQLERDPEELSRLYHDLLIGVTEFFRDPEAWAAFSEAIKPILERKEQGDEVRVWSAGCAAGPEAYTLAMVIAERLRRSGRQLPVKVFATDVHRGIAERRRRRRLRRRRPRQAAGRPAGALLRGVRRRAGAGPAGTAAERRVQFAQHRQGSAVHPAGRDLLPQRADLPADPRPAQGDLAVPLRAEGRGPDADGRQRVAGRADRRVRAGRLAREAVPQAAGREPAPHGAESADRRRGRRRGGRRRGRTRWPGGWR